MNQNSAKIYVGNLSYQTSEDSLRETFGAYGKIVGLKIITEPGSGRSKGFGFITFESSSAAEEALQLDNTSLDGRQIKVNIAKDNYGGGRRGNYGGGGFNNRRDR